MRLECCDCKELLPAEAFSKKPKTKRGYSNKCQKCHNTYVREIWYPKNREKQIKSSKTWSENNKSQVIATKYGIPVSDADKLLLITECQICNSKVKLVIDHNHETGKVRGRLCTECNLGLGKLGDTAESLTKALNYLNTAVW